ncbi:helix-turn-helix transcriptional regulator [Kitasatospora sp. NPDC058263]
MAEQPDWAFLGHEIRMERLARGFSQQQLAEQAGLDRKTVSHYENGRRPGPGRIPDGYYAVARVLGWQADDIDARLERRAAPETPPAVPRTVVASAVSDLFPAVGRFARAAVAAGGDPALRDLLEEAADRLLQSIPQRQPQPAQSGYGLAAYRPHAWAEGDTGVPDDDAARIEQALEEHARRARP